MRRECLTAAELTALSLGELPDTALDELTDHVEHCPRCERAARSLDQLSDPVIDALRDTVALAPEPIPIAARVGAYEILGELGRGSMGIVYRARHVQLDRLAALKVMLGGEFSVAEERARFQTEAEAAARLQHPNIVQVYEVGTFQPPAEQLGTEGARPYFTLEYVAGGNLAQRLAGRPQPPRQAAMWLERLARAAHYAHEHGVVHRDLKPSNVLLTPEGQPKLCDFGVAKVLTGSDLKTRTGALIGTVEYMAPEQAAARSDIGPAADVYALGAILYTMLTGRPPFQAAGLLETLAQVRFQEPVSPRRLNPQVARDLETICLKCLQKEPHKRYPSAASLADDLERFRAGVPIKARPVGQLERLAKWARRNPTVAGLLAGIVAVTVIAFALIAWQWREAVQQRFWADEHAAAEAQARTAAEQAGLRAQQATVLARHATLDAQLAVVGESLSRATMLCERGEVAVGLATFARSLALAVHADDQRLERVARHNIALWSRVLVRPCGTFAHRDWVTAVALTRDGRTAATASLDGTARLWDTATGRPIGAPLGHGEPVWTVAFSPDGRLLVSGSGKDNQHGTARLWQADSGTPVGAALDHHAKLQTVAFSGDGKRFLTVSVREAQLWDTATRAPIGPALRHPPSARPAPPAPPAVMTGAVSPDGRIVLTGGGADGVARLWDAATGQAVAVLRHAGPVEAVAFSPDSAMALTGSWDGTARLWDCATGQPIGKALRHHGLVRAVAFAPDGATVATGTEVVEQDPRTGKLHAIGGAARVWSTAGTPVGIPLVHPKAVRTVALTGAGLLLTGAADACARVFEVASSQQLGQPLLHEGTVMSCAVSADGRTAITGAAGYGEFQAARLWRLPPGLRTGIVLTPPAVDTWKMQFGKDGQLVTGGRDGAVLRWDTRHGTPVGNAAQHPHSVNALVLSHDERTVAVAWSDGTVGVFDRDSKRQLRSWHFDRPANTLAFTSDDRTLLTAGSDGTVRLWDIADGQPRGLPLGHDRSVLAAALDPGEQTVLTVTDTGTARRWDWHTGQLLKAVSHAGAPSGPPGSVLLAALAPDTRCVATATRGPHAQLWSSMDGTPLGPPLAHRTLVVNVLCFSSDGGLMLTGSDDGIARLWDAATGRSLGPPLAHAGPITALAIAPDSRRIAIAERPGQVRLCNVPAALGGSVESVRLWVELMTATELDPYGASRALDRAAVLLRRDQLKQLGDMPPE